MFAGVLVAWTTPLSCTKCLQMKLNLKETRFIHHLLARLSITCLLIILAYELLHQESDLSHTSNMAWLLFHRKTTNTKKIIVRNQFD